MKKFAGDIIITLHMRTKNHNHMMYGSSDTEWDRQNLSLWVIFCPFNTPCPPYLMILKIKILQKNEKPGDIIILYIHVHHKWRSYDIWFLKYKVQQTEIFVILGHSLPFQPPDNLENQNFKIEKNTWRYYHFTHLHHKWQSYDVWFLRYGVQQTEFFVILDWFLPFYPPKDPENLNFENMKKNTLRYYHYTNVYLKWQSHDVLFLRYGVRQTVFGHFGLFFALLPPSL